MVAHLRSRLAALLGVQALAALWTAVGLAALAAILLDAVVILPEAVRAWAFAFLIAVAAAVAAGAAIHVRRLTAVRVARRFEQSRPSLGTALTNAVQLARRAGRTPVEELLRLGAVLYGRRMAARLAVWPVARRGTLGLGGAAGAVVLLWGLAPILWPGVFQAVLPRFLDPHGDHPPYSRIRIEVRPGDTEALYGGQCEIHASTAGGPAERLHLVTESPRGTTSSVMFRAPDGAFFQTLTNLREETRYYVTDGRARSRRFRIAVQFTPRITLAEVQAQYPAYTGMKPRTYKIKSASEKGDGDLLCAAPVGPSGQKVPVPFFGTDLAVPVRTALALRVASNRPLAAGTVQVTPILGGQAREVGLAPVEEGGSVVAGGLEVTEAVAFAISVTDSDGLVSAESVKGRVLILPDRRPGIVVLEPGRHAIATPEVAIPLRVQAEDDYAVEGVLWFRGLNRSVERSVGMALAAKRGPQVVEAAGRFDLKDLGVRPGDRIEYFFEAVDNWPDGPNVATSSIYTLEIISLEQYQEILRSLRAQEALFEQYTALASALRRISERADAAEARGKELAEKGGGTPEEQAALRAELAALGKALAEYLQAQAQVLGAPGLFDVEAAFHESIGRQNPVLKRLMDELGGMLGKPEGEPVDAAGLAALAEALRDLAGRIRQEVGEPATLITAVVDLLARAEAFAQLAAQQGELARLAQRFKDHQGALSRVQQMELQELAGAERRIRDAVRSLVEELPELARRLPDSPQYDALRGDVYGFVQAVAELMIQGDLSDAADYLSALNGPAGHPPAQAAAEKMDSLVAKLEGMDMPGKGAACLRFQPALAMSLGHSLQQILAAMRSRGMGGDGMSGYGLYGQDVGLYGPDVQLAGGTGRGRDDRQADAPAEGAGVAAGDATDPFAQQPKGPARVRLQRDAKFPLRYRNLVGEYFRAVAESEE